MIACVYCGGEHARPADVKQCWADQQAATSGADGAQAADAAATATTTTTATTAATITATTTASSTAAAARAADRASLAPVPVRRGPPELGRNVLVAPRQAEPAQWAGCQRIVVDSTVIDRPGSVLHELRAAAHERRGLIVELAVDIDAVASDVDMRPVYELDPTFTFEVDELRHLVITNAVDLRDIDHPRWPALSAAVALGAVVSTDGSDQGDVVTQAGQPMWVDAGPVRFTAPIDGVPVVPYVQIEHGQLLAPLSNASEAELAPDQLAAVTHQGGAARIIAPAGSGKTRVLTERARHVLAQWQLPPAAVTLVAFNKRAQEEIVERTRDLPGLHVRTLNAIALAIINGSPPFAPQKRTWRTYDEPEVRRVLGNLVQTPRKLNVDPIASWIDALSLVRLGLVEPGVAEARYGGDVNGLADVWPHYRAALERAGAVDFDDQVYRAIEVLLTQPATRAAAQRACRVLLVDEFQDLTPAHLLLIRLLAAPGGAVFGVGDDDQTIYGYNGADPAWLINFDSYFPHAGAHPLTVNYRCTAGIVDVADRLLRHNVRRVDKVITAASNDTAGWVCDQSDDPVAASASAVRQAIESGVAPADIAVLTRVNALLAPIQVALSSAAIPIRGGVGAEFVERTAVRAALAWLRLARGTNFDAADIGEALRRPSRGLHPRVRDWAGEQSDVAGLERLAARLNTERDVAKVTDFVADLQRLAGMVRRGAPSSDVLDLLIDRIGLGGAVATLDQGRHGMNRSAQGDDLLALRQLARLHPDVATFEGWLRDQLMTRRSADGVVLSTVHRVKGQEWRSVVVHLADADQYPHRLAEEIEEERRLFHVAITRAREHATVVSGPAPSPFVAELTTEPPEHPPEPPPRRPREVSAKSRRDVPDHPLLDRQSVYAVTGLVIVDQGHDWTIVELEPEAAVAERGAATRRFPIGAKVETKGKQRGQLGPRPGEVDEASALMFDLLRSFRDEAKDGKPAYTVFDDKTLAAIATALPADLAELARVKGVGPAKLEQYGDDVLALVEAATADRAEKFG